ncbi:hypothetical protein JL721_13175 [Aureococcus anophagefferens]|nr:hypothetical protein JL721_13175 [Aureococcus anophagefferens]
MARGCLRALGASLLAPVAAAMLCGAGQEEPLGRLGGGTGLRSLSVSVWLKSTEGCAPLKGRAYAAGDAAQWHEGCTLVSGIFRDPPPALWKGQDAVWRNQTSGNDFGLSLSGDGRALFGARLHACCVPGAAPVPAAYAGVDAAYDATERRGCCGSSGRYALEDVPEVLRVGQLYRGCLRAPALDPVAVDADGARRAMSETALEPPPRYPLYFVAGADEGSQAMRDAFVGGLRDDWDLRERRPGDLHPTAAVEGQGRWLTKMRLALRAGQQKRAKFPTSKAHISAVFRSLGGRDAPDAAAVAVVSDMDLVFFRPVAPAVRRLLADRDVVFQRDAADKRDVNLGFFAFRCNGRVRALLEGVIAGVTLPWNDTRYERICRKGAGTACRAPSDQFVLNRLLRRPELLGLRSAVAWGFLPLEVATESYLKTRVPASGAFHMYFKTDNVMFHANAGAGHKSARSSIQGGGGTPATRLTPRRTCLRHACW